MNARTLPLLLLALLLSACALVAESPETYFYSLYPVARPEQARPLKRPGSLGVGPLAFPELLKRPQIVTRRSPAEVDLAEFHQWGGSLAEEFLHVLADDLSTRLALERVLTYPWDSRNRPDYQLRLTVERFDGALGGEVVLRARWQLLARSRRGEAAGGRLTLRETAAGPGYADYVAAQSRLVDRLAAKVAEALHRLVDGE